MLNLFYTYIQQQFKQSGNGLVKLILMQILGLLLILIVNTAFYISGHTDQIPVIYRQLTLPSLYPTLLQQPWSLITYSFVHKGFIDLFWDIYMLYLFGTRIASATPSKHVWRLYGLGQMVGALIFCMVYQLAPPLKGICNHLIGPSPAIYAIMTAVCTATPGIQLNLFFFLLPIRYIATAWIVFTLARLPSQEVGHCLAELGGALVGYGYAKMYKRDMGKPFFKISSFYKLNILSLKKGKK